MEGGSLGERPKWLLPTSLAPALSRRPDPVRVSPRFVESRRYHPDAAVTSRMHGIERHRAGGLWASSELQTPWGAEIGHADSPEACRSEEQKIACASSRIREGEGRGAHS